jgi:hypothetical protein
MVRKFFLSPRVDTDDFRYRIKKLVKECNVPKCWELKDPSDNRIYLSRFETIDRKGRYVRLRRLLFFLEYKEDPEHRIISMRCENTNCLNPAHMRVKGFEPEYDHIMNQISREPNILTFDQVRKWHLEGEAAAA